ncbi:MAG: serine/threonine protein kinase [Aggregatilineales bacterium]
MSDLINQTLGGRYEILELIGEGGSAAVYKARQIQLDRLVAVKVLHSFLVADTQFSARFEREARLIARLHHPNIIQVYDFQAIPAERLYYMVVELIVGSSLDKYLAKSETATMALSLSETLRISRDIANALNYAHEQGVIHRDIKPANVMFEHGQRVVLTDFGIARMVAQSSITARNSLLGTPSYMAPEQCLGQPGDARADIYSLGIMMYEMATGRLPFSATSPMAMIMEQVHTLAPLPDTVTPDLPLAVSHFIMHCLEKQPGRRFQSTHELLDELDKLNELKPDASITLIVPTSSTLELTPFSLKPDASITLIVPTSSTLELTPFSELNRTSYVINAPQVADKNPVKRVPLSRSPTVVLALFFLAAGIFWCAHLMTAGNNNLSLTVGVDPLYRATSSTAVTAATPTPIETSTSSSTATATWTATIPVSVISIIETTSISETPVATISDNNTSLPTLFAPTNVSTSAVPPTHIAPTQILPTSVPSTRMPPTSVPPKHTPRRTPK